MRHLIPIMAGALALGGCASERADRQPTTPDQTAPPAAGQEQEMTGEMAAMCPMEVEGTTVRADDTGDGVALSFTTTGDVAELRRRVAHMAMMYNQHQSGERGMMMRMHGGMEGHQMEGQEMEGQEMEGQEMEGQEMEGGAMKGGEMMMPPSTARSEDIDGGARLVLTPRDPAQLATLRQQARQMSDAMASRQCPMMEHGEPDQRARRGSLRSGAR